MITFPKRQMICSKQINVHSCWCGWSCIFLWCLWSGGCGHSCGYCGSFRCPSLQDFWLQYLWWLTKQLSFVKFKSATQSCTKWIQVSGGERLPAPFSKLTTAKGKVKSLYWSPTFQNNPFFESLMKAFLSLTIFSFFMDCNEDFEFSSEVAGANSLKQNCNFRWLNNGTIAPRLLLPHQDRRSNPIMHLGCIFVRWSPNNKSPEIDQLRTTYQVVGPARTASEDLGPGMIDGR